ncbi:MAG TPA: SGNH/GDSL hydrolase family protein [Blastocatellia bacterium]|jgi:lysophospholipase L1-like esterase
MITLVFSTRGTDKICAKLRKTFSYKRFCLTLCGVLLATQFAAQRAQAASTLYTALGDSIGFGLFAPIGDGYVPTYERFIEADTGASVSSINLSVPGWTSGDLLGAIRGNLLFRVSVAASPIVTINIGGNDLLGVRSSYKDRTCGGADNQDCLRAGVETFSANFNAIVAEVRSLRGSRNTIIRTMDIYNPYVNEDRAQDTWPNDQGNDFQVLKPYIEAVNSQIAATATARNIPYAKVYLAFNGPNGDMDPGDRGLIAFDGLHPNGSGHRLIAELLRGLGYSPFQN